MAMATFSGSLSSVYTCKCLNVTIHPRVSSAGAGAAAVKIANPRDYHDLKEDQLSQKIFQGSTEVAEMELDVGGVRNEQPLLFSASTVGNWSFYNCLNCKTATHCCRSLFAPIQGRGCDNVFPKHLSPSSSSPQNILLVNITQMISDQKKIRQLGQSQEFSPLFRIIIPSSWGSPDKWRSNSASDSFFSTPISPTSPSAYSQNSGRRVSAFPSPSSSQPDNLVHQSANTYIQKKLQTYLQEEEAALESRIKKFEEEQREAFEAKAEKARQDRNYLLNLIKSKYLDESSGAKTIRARQFSVESHDGSDDVFPRARRESAPTRPIDIASGPSVNYPGVPMALGNLGSPLGVASPVYGGLVEVQKGSGGMGSPAILNPVTLTLPANSNNNNNNNSYPTRKSRTRPRGNREFRRPTPPPAGLFSMDDEEAENIDEEEEEEDLEDLGDTGNCSPFEAVECSDLETDPDDNSQEDLRRDTGGVSINPAGASDKERKNSKYSTSAPMNISVFPQLNRGTMDIPLDEVEVDEEEEARHERGVVESTAGPQEPDPAQIAASMQALAMSHRDEDDPEAIFGERPRRRLNTLELYQIRQFKKPTTVSKQSTANAPGLGDEGFSSSGRHGSGF